MTALSQLKYDATYHNLLLKLFKVHFLTSNMCMVIFFHILELNVYNMFIMNIYINFRF